MATLEQADAALSVWRDRLAAASRNISELSELPEYGIAKELARGTGRLAAEARHLAATMDELWQGVLLIGAALDQAEKARRAGSRLWRGEDAAQQALDILNGTSITVDLAETPVLHRRLLAGTHAVATVSPDTLLRTMDAAFDRARDSLIRITHAARDAAALADALRQTLAGVPGAGELTARLDAAIQPDPLDQLDALNALKPDIAAAAAAAHRVTAQLATAQAQLAALQRDAAAMSSLVATCRAQVEAPLPGFDAAALDDLAAWLTRLADTLRQGRVAAAGAGLASWDQLHTRLRTECDTLAAAATRIMARRDELAARLGALRVKHKARGQSADAEAEAARASLARSPVLLDAAERAIAAYAAALAQP